jgi:hypothetical protein
MLTLGPSHGIIFNTLLYPLMLLWLFRAPTRGKDAALAHPGPRPCRHHADHPRHRHAAGPD